MDKFCVKRSYRPESVTLRFSVKGGYSVRIDGGSDMSTTQARELAKALVEESDRADARAAAKAASEKRREKWREREIASGRMQVMSFRDVLAK